MSSVDGGSERRTAALMQVDEYLAAIPGTGRLLPKAAKRYADHGYNVGWEVASVFSDGIGRLLHLVVDSGFPYTPPRVAVPDGPDPLAWPHLEEHGFLCVLPPDSAVSSRAPADVAAYVLGEACRLIEEGISGSNVEDFRSEFLSYWALAVDESAPRFLSTLDPTCHDQQIVVWRGKTVRVAGESRDALGRWLGRWGATPSKNDKYRLLEAVRLWLPKPLAPAEYPDTAADVQMLAQRHSPEAARVLENLASRGMNEIDVVLGAPTERGSCFGALVLRRPRRSAAGSKRGGDPLAKGFRPGRVPQWLAMQRYFSAGAKPTKAIVKRADHLWIHGRDQDKRQALLREARVAILGCGSLGGPLARLLAQAGVGNLLLVDPATLDWPNVGRHELGARSVGRPKAHELARELERAFPHLGDVASRSKRVGLGESTLMAELLTYDIIVSTMGNWAAESFLNDSQQEGRGFPPIVYGWVEAHAAAAHAVVVPGVGACLCCGVDDRGRPNLAVTDWPNGGDSLHEPACGAMYTPYGPAELCWAHALLSEVVVDAVVNPPTRAHHYIWIGRRRRVAEVGGTWAATWVGKMGDPGEGGVTVDRTWPPSVVCPVCATSFDAA